MSDIFPKKSVNGSVNQKSSINGGVTKNGGVNAGIERAKNIGTRNYEELDNKPSINDILLVGDISFEDLGLLPITTEMIDEIFDDESGG